VGPNENYLHRLWQERGLFCLFLKFENHRLFLAFFVVWETSTGRKDRRPPPKKGLGVVVIFFFIIFMVIKGGVHNMGCKQFPERDFIAHLTQPFYHPFG
jgi:hypothetical protein